MGMFFFFGCFGCVLEGKGWKATLHFFHIRMKVNQIKQVINSLNAFLFLEVTTRCPYLIQQGEGEGEGKGWGNYLCFLI